MKRYSGKWFTIAFAVVILALLVVTLSVRTRLESLTAKFEVLRREWGQVAMALEVPLQRADAAIAEDSTDEAVRWKELRRNYLDSSLYEEQSRLLAPLWNSYRTWLDRRPAADPPVSEASDDKTAPASALGAETRARLDRFIEVDRQVEKMLSDPLGRLTHTMLLLDYPPRVYPTLQAIFASAR